MAPGLVFMIPGGFLSSLIVPGWFKSELSAEGVKWDVKNTKKVLTLFVSWLHDPARPCRPEADFGLVYIIIVMLSQLTRNPSSNKVADQVYHPRQVHLLLNSLQLTSQILIDMKIIELRKNGKIGNKKHWLCYRQTSADNTFHGLKSLICVTIKEVMQVRALGGVVIINMMDNGCSGGFL